jgi:hypothetical protein
VTTTQTDREKNSQKKKDNPKIKTRMLHTKKKKTHRSKRGAAKGEGSGSD